MKMWEMMTMMDMVEFADRTIWETSRIQCLYVAQKFCKKNLKLADIYSLPWDKEPHAQMTEEEKQAALKLQNKLADFLNNNMIENQ